MSRACHPSSPRADIGPEFCRGFSTWWLPGGPGAVVEDLDLSAQTIYTWRKQDQIDRDEARGLSSAEHAELKAARLPIVGLERAGGKPAGRMSC